MKKLLFLPLLVLAMITMFSACEKESIEQELPNIAATSRSPSPYLTGLGWVHLKGAYGSSPIGNGGGGISVAEGCEYEMYHLCGLFNVTIKDEVYGPSLEIDPSLTAVQLEKLSDDEIRIVPIDLGKDVLDFVNGQEATPSTTFTVATDISIANEVLKEDWGIEKLTILKGKYTLERSNGPKEFSVVVKAKMPPVATTPQAINSRRLRVKSIEWGYRKCKGSCECRGLFCREDWWGAALPSEEELLVGRNEALGTATTDGSSITLEFDKTNLDRTFMQQVIEGTYYEGNTYEFNPALVKAIFEHAEIAYDGQKVMVNEKYIKVATFGDYKNENILSPKVTLKINFATAKNSTELTFDFRQGILVDCK